MGVLRETFCPQYKPSIKTFGPIYPKCDCVSRIDQDMQPAFCKHPENFRCVKESGTMQLPLSHSSVQDFIKCPFLYYLKNIRGIQTLNAQTSKAIKMGKLWDAALQALAGADINMGAIVQDYEIGDMEIAKVKALFRAFKALEIKIEPGFELQATFNKDISVPSLYEGVTTGVTIKGFYDFKYPNYFEEHKLSSRPDNYLDIFAVQSQIGTYFIADEALEYVIMKVARTPDLRSTAKFKEESPTEHEERTYQDILSRPSFYFLGWNKENKTYGKKFFRKEFNIEEILTRFKMIEVIMKDCGGFDGWYKNDASCNTIFGPCDMKGVCRFNTMSETVYKIKDKPEGVF